jgi:hypothetical protein
MTAKDFAKEFDGIEYGGDTLDAAAERAAKYGVITLYGHSDDNIEIRGPVEGFNDEIGAYGDEGFNDEIGAYGGVTFRMDRQGVVYFPDRSDDDQSDEMADTLIAELNRWRKAAVIVVSGCPWEFSGTFIACHGHKFRVMEDGELYGEGVCFDRYLLPWVEQS